MKTKKIIGISGSIIFEQGMHPMFERSYVNNDYIQSVIRAGAIPFIIPFNESENVIKEQIESCDGLILSGGHDVFPHNYGQEPHQKIGEVWPERDVFDLRLIKYATEKQIPILGICRGFQMINVNCGGSLVQDLSLKAGVTIKHAQNQRPDLGTHHVTIHKDSILYGIFNQTEIMVNSFHHQIVDKLGTNLIATAISPDGVVEAFQAINGPWMMGVQWHPEMMSQTNDGMQAIFNELVEQA